VNNFRSLVSYVPRPASSLALLALGALLAVAGCDKANDLPRMKDEALATAKTYQAQVDELARRAQAIGKRAATLPAQALNSASAQKTYQEAISVLGRARNDLQQIPVRVQAGTAGKPEDLVRLLAELHERTEDAIREAAGGLAAVESWVAITEQRPAPSGAAGAASAAAGTVPAQGEPGAGEPAVGSDAAIR
jgi:hypothetical protein